MSDAEFHDRFYDSDAERIFSSPLYRQLLAVHVEFLRAVTPQLATGRILSIGCGDGRRELAMAKYAGGIVGIDASPVAIDRARLRARRLGIDNVEFQVDDAATLNERFRAQFDAIWCAGLLHHLPEPQIGALLRACAVALKTGGRFVSMDPNARRAVNLFKPLVRRAYRRYHSDGERELRPDEVVELVASAGFRNIEIRFTDSFISPLAWVFPRLTGPFAALLARLDSLLVRVPLVKQRSSGFAVVAQNGV